MKTSGSDLASALEALSRDLGWPDELPKEIDEIDLPTFIRVLLTKELPDFVRQYEEGHRKDPTTWPEKLNPDEWRGMLKEHFY